MTADPSDKLLWRKAPVRLEAEMIRDSMLKVSGLLNRRRCSAETGADQAGGPTGSGWKTRRRAIRSRRRSLYLS